MKRFLMFLMMVLGLTVLTPLATPTVSAISDEQKDAIYDHCESIRSILKNVQKADARARVFLGGHYETVLTNYVVPLNVRLVENNLSTAEFVENQNNIASTRTLFVNDFVSYQQDLEELVSMNCKESPDKFYEKLDKVRQKRKIVEQDTLRMRSLISEHIKLVNQLKRKL